MEKVLGFISDQFNLDEEDLSEETSFDELGADEVDLADLVLVINSEFEIEIPDEEINRVSNISDLIDVVEAAMGGLVD